MVPPPGANNLPPVTEQQAAENNRRKAMEDEIRGAYTATFATEAEVAALAKELSLDEARLMKVMTDARGNHRRLAGLLRTAPADKREQALTLLEVISKKDRSDVDPAILADHLTTPSQSNALFAEYVLSPRIDIEQLTPFRSMFAKEFTPAQAAEFAADPAKWEKWVNDNIQLVEAWFPAGVRLLPSGVMATRKADTRSRDVFYVAGARSFGIPSRIDPITGKTQWADAKGEWIDAHLTGGAIDAVASSCQGTLKLGYEQAGRIDDPKYYTHFTISKIEGGRPQLLGYDDFAPWSTTFAEPQKFDCGEYMLVSGQRMADGSVLARVTLSPSAMMSKPT